MKQILRLILVGISLTWAASARADAPRGADVVEGSWMPQRRVDAQQNAQWREHVRASQTIPTAPPRPEFGPNDTRLDVQVVEPYRSVAPVPRRKTATRRLRANNRLPRRQAIVNGDSQDDLSRQVEAAREARQNEDNARLRVSEESAREQSSRQESQREANNRERLREEMQREANGRQRVREENQREENSRQRIREENQREENARLERRAEENRQQSRREEAQREANRQEARRQEIRREEIRQEENRQQARREENRREEVRQEQAREEARRLQH